MPEFHTRANEQAARQMAEHVWRKADGLIAVSRSARRDAVELLGLPEKRIEVIYHGVPEEYFQAQKDRPFGRSYVLHVGTVEPRKNLDLLLDAWAALTDDIRQEYDLVIAGPAGWKSERTLARLKSNPPGVKYLGYVPEAELPRLTANATVLAYPSLYEGFGFPLAQAMACGTPVITSNVSSMPEIAGDGGLLCDPHSVSELRDALFRLLTSPTLQNELGGRGKERASVQFRWDLIARQSWSFFERVAA